MATVWTGGPPSAQRLTTMFARRAGRAPAALVSIALIAIAIAGAGCGSGGSSQAGAGAATGALGSGSASTNPAGRSAQAKAAVRAASRLPAAVLASVGGVAVTQAEFRRAYAAARTAYAADRGAPKLDRKRAAALAQATVSQLIQARWTEQQARAAGVVVTESQVAATVASQRRALGGAARWRAYLRRSAQSEAQLAERVRLQLLEQRLSARRAAQAPAVTDAQVERFFREHIRAFMLPARKLPNGRRVGAVRLGLGPYRARIRLLLREQETAQLVNRQTIGERQRLRAATLCRPAYVIALCANSGEAR